MHIDMSIYRLVADASLLVQIVMLILILASLISWTMIISKARVIKQANKQAHAFEDRFWSGADLPSLYEKTSAKRNLSGMEHMFVAGFKEYIRLHKTRRVTALSISDTSLRSMKVALSREVDFLENHLSFLATVGSTSPYIGLFGTVWGIMNSFRALSDAQQATLAAVAPGIAEALIATAMGLLAAIPAVIAYNRYSHQTDRLITRYDNFVEEFTALLQRQAIIREGEQADPEDVTAIKAD
ncbi:MAG: protein TolQ [Gammaproteobacteria bacterium TMED119]|nr:MAG: protein TolQ [Gammaproteobacteria bacterium TMED119]RCL45392.1 MAG: protein TolQ [Candidatus Thioglobus sp.]|tara:strand:- start:604 stop:1326 length:723 start_codon:yes stop_codon:yes gene_type:complete